jgi:hypothetical protein
MLRSFTRSLQVANRTKSTKSFFGTYPVQQKFTYATKSTPTKPIVPKNTDPDYELDVKVLPLLGQLALAQKKKDKSFWEYYIKKFIASNNLKLLVPIYHFVSQKVAFKFFSYC